MLVAVDVVMTCGFIDLIVVGCVSSVAVRIVKHHSSFNSAYLRLVLLN